MPCRLQEIEEPRGAGGFEPARLLFHLLLSTLSGRSIIPVETWDTALLPRARSRSLFLAEGPGRSWDWVLLGDGITSRPALDRRLRGWTLAPIREKGHATPTAAVQWIGVYRGLVVSIRGRGAVRRYIDVGVCEMRCIAGCDHASQSLQWNVRVSDMRSDELSSQQVI